MHRAALARAPARPFVAALLLILALQAPPSSARPEGSLAGQVARNAQLPRAPLLPLDAFDSPGGVRKVRLAPDGAYLAYIVDAGGNAQLYAQPLPAGPARRLIGLEDGARIHWSQDGSLLFVEQQRSLAAVAVRDGASARIAVFDADKARRSGHNECFAGVDPSRPSHAIVREDDIVRRRSRLLRVGADGAREVLYDGPGMVDGHLLGADGKLAVIRRLASDLLPIKHTRW